MSNTYENISPTARLVAYFRVLTKTPYAQEVSTICDAEPMFKTIGCEPWFATFFDSRYTMVNRLLHDRGMKNIFEFAAGLSPRGLEFSQNPDIHYVETDLDIIVEKERIVQTILGATQRSNLSFATANAFDVDSLLSASKHLAGPVAFVSEGFLPYLSIPEKQLFFNTLRVLLKEYPGSVFMSTDVWSSKEDETFFFDEHMDRAIGLFSKVAGRSIAGCMFSSNDEARSFIEDAGLSVEICTFDGDAESLASFSLLNNDEERQRVRTMITRRRVWVIKVKE